MLERLLPEQYLELLRASDRLRYWHTLDDKRVCILCERIFSGRELEFRQERGTQRWQCPTEDCPSGFQHWLVWHPPGKAARGEEEGQRECSFL